METYGCIVSSPDHRTRGGQPAVEDPSLTVLLIPGDLRAGSARQRMPDRGDICPAASLCVEENSVPIAQVNGSLKDSAVGETPANPHRCWVCVKAKQMCHFCGPRIETACGVLCVQMKLCNAAARVGATCTPCRCSTHWASSHLRAGTEPRTHVRLVPDLHDDHAVPPLAHCRIVP
jgi:hypothetical protein